MSLSDSSFRLDKLAVAHSFSDAAVTYDSVTKLQKKVAGIVMGKVNRYAKSCGNALDLGCGTGLHTAELCQMFPDARVWGVDLAPGMLEYASKRLGTDKKVGLICGDAENLPLEKESMDFVFSNFSLQWCPDLKQVFREVYRVLKPGGWIFFSLPGERTLWELKESWSVVDANYSHVNRFSALDEISDIAQNIDMEVLELYRENEVMYYHQLRELTAELKAMGAHNVTSGRARALTGKNKIQRLVRAYEGYRDQEKGLPATWEVIYGAFRKV